MAEFDLKLCPFCGGYAATAEKKVFCVYCGAELATEVHTTEDMVALWNERVYDRRPNAADAALVEALEAMLEAQSVMAQSRAQAMARAALAKARGDDR